MAGKDDPRLQYAASAAVRASVRPAGEAAPVQVVPAKAGERYDICLPANDQRSAADLYAEMNALVTDPAVPTTRDMLLGLGKATGAGDWYELQVKNAVAKFSRVTDEVAADFAKTGKYTSAHAAKVLAARRALAETLKDVFPAISFYRTQPFDALESTLVTERLGKDVAAMAKLEGRPRQNLDRNSMKRLKGTLDYSKDVPVVVDSKLATMLKGANKFMVSVEIAPAVGTMLTAKTEQEQRQAAIELASKSAGMAADSAVAAKTMALCVGFGVFTGGWGFLACGVGSIAAGLAFGHAVEEVLKTAIPLALDALPPKP